MDPLLQTKLLRFVQTGSYERVGDPRPRRTDIRFLAATNRDPLEAVRSGRLREDLYYRLNVVPIRMPPLRDRGEDIVLIARRFLEQFTTSERRSFRSFAPEVEARFLSYAWPGNVRQLQNVVRNVVVLNDAKIVTLDMLPPLEEAAPHQTAAGLPATIEPSQQPSAPRLPVSQDAIEPLAVAERHYIEHVITLCGGNLQLAARKLGISPSTIYRKKEAW